MLKKKQKKIAVVFIVMKKTKYHFNCEQFKYIFQFRQQCDTYKFVVINFKCYVFFSFKFDFSSISKMSKRVFKISFFDSRFLTLIILFVILFFKIGLFDFEIMKKIV